MDAFEGLRMDPLQSPVYHIRDTTDRELGVVLVNPFVITYWNDPLVSEVRIVDLEMVR